MVVWQNWAMSSVDGLIVGGHQIDRDRLAEICDQFGVVELALFGSVGRGQESSDSDVDLLYVAGDGAQLGFALNRLEDKLAELFGRPVDEPRAARRDPLELHGSW